MSSAGSSNYVPLLNASGDLSTPVSPAPGHVQVAIKQSATSQSPAPASSAYAGPNIGARRDGGGGDDSGGKSDRTAVPTSWFYVWVFLSIGAVVAIVWLGLRVAHLQSQIDNNTPQPEWSPPVLTSTDVYLAARADLLSRNAAMSGSGSQPALSASESRVDSYMSDLRAKLQNDTGFFPTAHYFFGVRPILESSRLFPIFQSMPKGGVLHIHTSSLGDSDYIIRNLTHRPNCYVFLSSVVPPGNFTNYTLMYYHPNRVVPGFVPIAAARAADPDFDSKLMAALEMSEANSPCNRTSDVVFPVFQDIFGRLGLLKIMDVYRDYYMDGLEKLIANGAQYVEVRAGISSLAALNGTRYPPTETLKLWSDIRQTLRTKYAAIGFDLHLIASYDRGSDQPTVSGNLQDAFSLKAAFPDVLIGFDLVAFEDAGHTTEYFMNTWIQHASLEASTGISLPFYFHDGESDQPNNTNVYDALICNTRRIGHGFNLWHFPYLERVARERSVAIEVCPLSNQILGYVADLRLHPAAGYFARGVPMVVSSDDPGIFGYVGMGYDYYVAYMAWGLNLIDLKQLLQNSLAYSALRDDPTGMALPNALAVLNGKWNDWITAVNSRIDTELAERAVTVAARATKH